ncbi:glycoside hydrolase family 79 protein [Atractiella rhizophila]|nr:glycoside hydrolase family 79 protein [Atractiella rhizophila]
MATTVEPWLFIAHPRCKREPIMAYRYLLPSIVFLLKGAWGQVTISIPASPPAGNTSHQLPPHYLGLSIEFASLVDFSGPPGQPNGYTKTCLDGLRNIGRRPLHFRIGGTTQDRATFLEDQSTPIINKFPYFGADQPTNLTFGPGYFESLHQIASGDPVVFGLRFHNASGEKQAVVASQALKTVPELTAFSIGNEADWYSDPGFANVTEYENTIQSFYRVVAASVEDQMKPAVFQAGDTCCKPTFFPAEQISAGLKNTTEYVIEAVGQHHYFMAACTPETSSQINLEKLMNHQNTVAYLDTLRPDIAAVENAGLTFVQSETNSIGCQGASGTSDSFGAALWTLDYALQLATRGVQRVDFHVGTNYRYAPFQPIQVNQTAPFTRPNYSALLTLQAFLGAANASVRVSEVGTHDPYLAAYVAYEHEVPKRVALINTHIYNATAHPTHPPKVTVSLEGASVSKVRRLTAAGADVRAGVLWSNQNWEGGCFPSGFELTEQAENGKVEVRNTEAVVVWLESS